MEMIVAEPYDMKSEPRGPYRLTLVELRERPVSAPVARLREQIYQLEARLWDKDLLESHGLEQITDEHPLAQPENLHTDGIYVRKLVMKAGTFVVAKRHAQEHVCIISQGRALVTTENGTQEIKAPDHFVSPAGSKRVVMVLEDMVWTTIHRTDKTDMREIEDELIIPEPRPALMEAV